MLGSAVGDWGSRGVELWSGGSEGNGLSLMGGWSGGVEGSGSGGTVIVLSSSGVGRSEGGGSFGGAL